MWDSVVIGFFAGIATMVVLIAVLEIDRRRRPIVSRSARVVSRGTSKQGMITVLVITFELDDGEKHEFRMSPRRYGDLTEGDRGTLKFRGRWFEGFERETVDC